MDVSLDASYPELGIRSFGKGTFHKPSLSGGEVGNKRLYRIEPDDLVFNNVFAWEGAIAVAQPEDAGRFGSHRFITCVPKKDLATSQFLCIHFLTREGMQAIGEASPGGAGRNRTLGLKALAAIQVPVPDYRKQLWFGELLTNVRRGGQMRAAISEELNALIPSVLHKALRGEL
jgi:type I restriction enzyme S subunit